MTDKSHTIAKMRRYASCVDEQYQVVNCKDLAVLISELPQWQSIDTAPDGEFILLYCGEVQVGMYWAHVDAFFANGAHGEAMVSPTHWMPLPSSPNAETK